MMKKLIAVLVALSFSLLLHAACSQDIGKATINELSVVSGDYVEIVRLNSAISTNGWSIYACRADQDNKCETLSIASTTNVTDLNSGRTYYKFPISNGNLNTYQIVLLDNANNPIDFLNATGGANYSRINTKLGTCSTFPYDTTASPAASEKLIYRGPDGTGYWAVDSTTGSNPNFTELATNNTNPTCTVPDYQLTKTVNNSTPFVGSNISYTLTVKNMGCKPAINATLTDTFPSTYLSTSSPTSWTITPLAYNATQTFTIPATVNSGSGVTVVNSANVPISSENINTTADNNASVTITPPCTCVPTNGNLIANPSFETLCQSAVLQTWNNVEGGTVNMRNNVCGWNMNGSGMETWENTTSKPASDGKVFVEIDGYSTTVDRLWQDLNTIAGKNYIIRFDYRKRDASHSDVIIAKWNGVEVGRVEGITTGWKTAEIEVVGTASLDTLSFEEPSTSNDSYGSWIDNIRVVDGTPTIVPCSTFQYDLYHRQDTINHLHTRIANQGFDVNVTVACTGTGEIPARKIKKIYAVTGACPTATTGLPVLWSGSADINDTARTITLNSPLLNSTTAYSNIKLLLETNASEFNCSTDTMAIRPASFTVTTPTSLKAEQFTLAASATNSGGGYNGMGSVSTTLQTPNSGCPISSNFLTFSSTPLHFTADTNTTEANATDVGIITLSLKDTTWTAVDQTADCIPDSNSTDPINGKFGCNIETNTTITIIPHHFDVNATLSNAVTGFTYLSPDLNMSAQLDLNITAKTADGNTTKNYNTGCYAKPTNYTINYTAPTITPAANNLTKLNYQYIDLNSTDINSTSFNFDANETIFTTDNNGTANLSVKINFDRSASKPVNPFDFNLTSADINDTDNVTGSSIPSGTATFVYGRARAYDIKTDQTPAPNPIEIEVYGKNSTNTFLNNKPQNVLYWYRNTDHDSNASGSILSGKADVPTISINPYIYPPLDGLHPIDITYFGTNPITKTVHLDISPWLWYSLNPAKIYNYGTDCTMHPCFDYQFFGTAVNSSGVQSGTFQGADFNLTPAKTIIKKGVKVFR